MTVVELDRTPATGRALRRAVLSALPGIGRRRGAGLPETELVLKGVRADRERLAEYARVCGFRLTDTLPVTYPHVLAFPLAMALMTAPDFPFPVVGLVHLANRITLHRPLPVDQPLDLAVRAENLRDHPRGRQVDVVATASVDGEVVWRDVSTYLHKERTGPARGDRPAAGEPHHRSGRDADDAPAGHAQAVWRVGEDVGRAYARVSGDRNPIHTSRLLARAFGFRRPIAHGMWTKARCLAQLAPRLPDAYTVEVTFRAPVLLPARVDFRAAAVDDGWRFTLHRHASDRLHLSGTVTAAVDD